MVWEYTGENYNQHFVWKENQETRKHNSTLATLSTSSFKRDKTTSGEYKIHGPQKKPGGDNTIGVSVGREQIYYPVLHVSQDSKLEMSGSSGNLSKKGDSSLVRIPYQGGTDTQ